MVLLAGIVSVQVKVKVTPISLGLPLYMLLHSLVLYIALFFGLLRGLLMRYNIAVASLIGFNY
jgi:hypothetical protein